MRRLDAATMQVEKDRFVDGRLGCDVASGSTERSEVDRDAVRHTVAREANHSKPEFYGFVESRFVQNRARGGK